MGIIFYILIASILPLANRRLYVLYPKPESKAASSPIIFKSATGEILPANASNIPLTSSARVKVELTSTLGFPLTSPTPSPSPTSSSSIGIGETSAQAIFTTFYRYGESSNELDNAPFKDYNKEPTIIDYTFNTSLGTKVFWVEFKDSNNRTDRKAAQILLVSATASPTPTPTPSSSSVLAPKPPISTQQKTSPPKPAVKPSPTPNLNQNFFIAPKPFVPEVNFQKSNEIKTKDCGVFCKLADYVNNFNKSLEKQMEQLLLKIGLLKQ